MPIVTRDVQESDLDAITSLSIEGLPANSPSDYRYPYRLQYPEDHYKHRREIFSDQLANKERFRLRLAEMVREENNEKPEIVAYSVWMLPGAISSDGTPPTKCVFPKDHDYSWIRRIMVFYLSTTKLKLTSHNRRSLSRLFPVSAKGIHQRDIEAEPRMLRAHIWQKRLRATSAYDTFFIREAGNWDKAGAMGPRNCAGERNTSLSYFFGHGIWVVQESGIRASRHWPLASRGWKRRYCFQEHDLGSGRVDW